MQCGTITGSHYNNWIPLRDPVIVPHCVNCFTTGGWKFQYPLSVLLKGTMTIGRFNLMPRPGLGPTVRIDICEDDVFTNFVIKAIYAMRNK